MLGQSATYNYFLSYGSVDMRKGYFSLSQLVHYEMNENPLDGNNVKSEDNFVNETVMHKLYDYHTYD